MEIKSDITINDFSAICLLCLKREHRLQPIHRIENFANMEAQSLNEIIHVCFGFEVSFFLYRKIIIFFK